MNDPVFYSPVLLAAIMAPAVIYYRRHHTLSRMQRGLRAYMARSL
jgi:hypothetical protein